MIASTSFHGDIDRGFVQADTIAGTVIRSFHDIGRAEATNSLEKMLAHQLAAVPKLAMEQMGRLSYERDAAVEPKRINAATRCMAVYQQGLLTLHKIRQNGQRITVQYVNLSNGSRAVIANVQQDNVDGLKAWPRKGPPDAVTVSPGVAGL